MHSFAQDLLYYLGDSLNWHNGQRFSTWDNDLDPDARNCAVDYEGAWWYRICHSSNLNGRYLGGVHASFGNGINWFGWRGDYYSMKRTEMKIRPN